MLKDTAMHKHALILIPTVLLACLTGCASGGDGATAAPTASATATDLCDVLSAVAARPADFAILDARSPSEYDDGHVPTALNVPFDAVQGYSEALPADKSAPIVTYCRAGRRAAILADELGAMGYTDVTVVPGKQMQFNGDIPSFGCSEQ